MSTSLAESCVRVPAPRQYTQALAQKSPLAVLAAYLYMYTESS